MHENEYLNYEGTQELISYIKEDITEVDTPDTTPFLYRQTPYNADGVFLDELVGGSVAWNQLVQNGDFASTSGWYTTGGIDSFSASNNEATVVVKSGYTDNTFLDHYNFNFINGHKYIVSFEYNNTSSIDGAYSYFGTYPYTTISGQGTNSKNAWSKFQRVLTTSNTTEARIRVGMRITSAPSSNWTYKIRNVMCIDITQMFGTTIADYVYTLEQATAGSGIAWLKSHGFFTKDYYPYNTGELISVKTSAKKYVGFNQWDEEWEVGTIDYSGNNSDSTNNIRSKNYIGIVSGNQYYIRIGGQALRVFQYSYNKVFIRQDYYSSAGIISLDNNTRYIRFRSQDGITTYNHDICINISKTEGTPKNGDYVPYEEHTYDISNIDLRGIPKLVNNELVYDGDTYDSSGDVTRKYGIVDLGTLNWSYNSARFYSNIVSLLKPVSSNTIIANIRCPKYTPTYVYLQTDRDDKTIGISNDGRVYIYDTAYSDSSTFTTAMSGVYLIYELATPTTETTDPYTNPQICEKDGTEEFIDNRDFPIPVGHNSRYADLPAIMDGDYLSYMARNITSSVSGDYMEKGVDYVTAGQKSGSTLGLQATIEGLWNVAASSYAHAEGTGTSIVAGIGAHAEGLYTLVGTGKSGHAEGAWTTVGGNYGHAEGYHTSAYGISSHAEGMGTTDNYNIAMGDGSHAEGGETSALGESSHAEGYRTCAEGDFSHTEGLWSAALKTSSHAEGYWTAAEELYSHAEGEHSHAKGDCSHAEGGYTTAFGNDSHAEGSHTYAGDSQSHAEGSWTSAYGKRSHAEGEYTCANGYASHAEGCSATSTKYIIASGQGAHAEGFVASDGTNIIASGNGSHAEGCSTSASGNYSHAEGDYTSASGIYSHAEGILTSASGSGSHAEGDSTIASGYLAHAEGYMTTASGECSHAEGGYSEAYDDLFGTLANSDSSHAEGLGTIADNRFAHAEGFRSCASGTAAHAEGFRSSASNYASHASGHYNAAMITGGSDGNQVGTAFVIGNGTSSSTLSNAFSVQYDGTVAAAGAQVHPAADYAEFFEWIDGNPKNTDRVGYFVTTDKQDPTKIIIANTGDDYILGIVSGAPCVIGNGDCNVWNGMTIKDDFGRTVYVEPGVPKYNPDYDPTQQYISRRNRKEWAAVGMLGVLPVRDDGTCKPGEYCTVGQRGIATKVDEYDRSINCYKVIERVSDKVVKVIFR